MAMDDSNVPGITPEMQDIADGMDVGDASQPAAGPEPGRWAGWWHFLGAVPSGLENAGMHVAGMATGLAQTLDDNAIDAWQDVTGAHDFNNLGGEPEGYGAGTPFHAVRGPTAGGAREAVNTEAADAQQWIADTSSTADDLYVPDPHTTGAIGEALFAPLQQITEFAANSALTGGTAGLGLTALGQGYARTKELEAQGVDAGTATESGVLSGASLLAMGAAGDEGSLAARIIKNAGINVASDMGNRFADSELLKSAGYENLAEQEQWNDAQSILSDIVIGTAFPLVHAGIAKVADVAATRSEAQLADTITANPGLFDVLHGDTGYVPAANIDDALTSLNAKHAADSAPGIPTDVASQGINQRALDTAIHQVLSGQDVNVDPIVRGMNTIPRPVDPAMVEALTKALTPEDDAEPDPFRYAERDDAGAVTGYRNGENFIPAFANLTDAQREVESRAAAQVLDDPEQAIADYGRVKNAKGEFTTDGGNLINTDEARELFPDYNAGPEGRSMNALAVHEPASWVAKQAWQRALARPVRVGKEARVFFTGGGTGAGKSTGPRHLPELGEKQSGADIVFDGNLNGVSSATKKIDAALKSGRKVHILYTFRDPVQAFIHGAVPRAERADYGRTVPIPVHVDTHVGAAETYLRLKEHYAGDSRVEIEAIHNDYVPKDRPDARSEITRDYPDESVRRHASADRGRLTSEVQDAFERERQAGRVSDRVYYGTLGARPEGDGSAPQGGARGVREDVGGAQAGGAAQTRSGSGRLQPGTGRAAGREPVVGEIQGVHGSPAEGQAGSVRGPGQVSNLNPAAGGVSASGADASIRSSDAAYGTPDRHPWVDLDTTKNIPLAGGVSADGRTIYISKYMPKTVEIDGKTIDAHEAVAVHEVEEQKVMLPDGPKDAEYMAALRADIASESKLNPKTPKIPESDLVKVERGEPLEYIPAHNIATIRENAFIRKTYGIDPEKYQKALADGIEEARKKAAQEGGIPADLDRTPYEDTGLTKLLPTKPGGALMQNRDRARAASLTQMAGIANAPDAQRLGFSRDPNTGAPMVSAENAAQAVPEGDLGKQDVVIFADGRKVPVRYAVVEAGDVAASHGADGSANPDYDGAKLQALNNGRVAGVQAAWQGANAEAYKQGLIADAGMFGIDPKAIEDKAHPMVIRLYDAKANFGDMGKASNESGSLGLSPSEQAMTDARALPDLDTLPLTESGDVSSNPASDFHRAFLRNLGEHDAAELVDANGRLNKTYMDRLRAALFAKAYGDPRLVEMQAESADPVAQNALKALTAAAPAWAKVDPAAPLGDYARIITAGMDVVRQAAESGQSVERMLAQGDLLDRNTAGDKWALLFAKNARSAKRMGEFLRAAAEMVAEQQRRLANGDLYGDARVQSADDITDAVQRLAEERYGQERPATAGNLFNAAGRLSATARAQPAGAEAEPVARGLHGSPDVVEPAAGEQAQGGRAAAGAAADRAPDAAAAREGAAARGAGQQQEVAPPPPEDPDLAGARAASARRPDMRLPDGMTATQALQQADEDVAQAQHDADAIKAAVNCFLQFGGDV